MDRKRQSHFKLPPSKQGRGGYLPRMAAQDELQESSTSKGIPTLPATCLLTALLLSEVLWGIMPAARAQRYAFEAVKSGANTPEIIEFSKFGCSGQQPGNVWRDLKLHLTDNKLARAFKTIKMPLSLAGRIQYCDVGILYPHIVFSIMYNYYRDSFDEYILGGARDKLSNFWDDVHRHPSYDGHPMHRHKSCHRKWAVPLSMHGDGTATTGLGKVWGKIADFVSWASCS